MSKNLFIYSDGGSRGNPGPAAAAFVIKNDLGVVIAEGHQFLGVTTNNVAEYLALISALNRALKLGAKKASCFLDSELVVRQLNGEYKVKEEKMRRLFGSLTRLLRGFEEVSFKYVPRSQNQRADALVNRALDNRP